MSTFDDPKIFKEVLAEHGIEPSPRHATIFSLAVTFHNKKLAKQNEQVKHLLNDCIEEWCKSNMGDNVGGFIDWFINVSVEEYPFLKPNNDKHE